MKSFTSSGTTSYVYRADGMRVSKSNSTGSTSYRYDGQMGMEDVDFASNGPFSKVTDYGLGARGVDGMYVSQSGSTSASYPLYDAHGNMISTLSKQGTSGYDFAALRTFDSCGVIRRGAQTGDPKGRYCANLGNKQDDESGLTYMRARYYDGTSGRFISPDPSRHGINWFCYANNDPVGNSDRDGNISQGTLDQWMIEILANIAICIEAKAIAFTTGLLAFMTSITNSGNGSFMEDESQKLGFLVALEGNAAMTTPLAGTSIGDQAAAEENTYNLMLEVAMWVILGGVAYAG